MDWSNGRDWCAQKGMRLASLKTYKQMKAVSNELNGRVGKKVINNWKLLRLKINLLQNIYICGCQLRTLVEQRDSSVGRTAHQWMTPLGILELLEKPKNLMISKRNKKLALVFTLETPNCATTAARSNGAICVRWRRRSHYVSDFERMGDCC